MPTRCRLSAGGSAEVREASPLPPVVLAVVAEAGSQAGAGAGASGTVAGLCPWQAVRVEGWVEALEVAQAVAGMEARQAWPSITGCRVSSERRCPVAIVVLVTIGFLAAEGVDRSEQRQRPI